jgi:hypothetical protein
MRVFLVALCLLVPSSVVYALKVERSDDNDVCKCLNFHHVYKTGMALCGDGGESGEIPGSYCTLINDRPSAFFPMQNHNYCINLWEAETQEGDNRTWCYVSAECSVLNGGRSVNSNVSEKICGETEPRLGDLNPRDLMEDIFIWDGSMIAKFAYAWEGPGMNEGSHEIQANPNGRCTIGASSDSKEENEAHNVICGDEKWVFTESNAVCDKCSPPENIGPDAEGHFIDRRTGLEKKRPRVEAWMYGPAGVPGPDTPDGGSIMPGQDDTNTFVMED